MIRYRWGTYHTWTRSETAFANRKATGLPRNDRGRACRSRGSTPSVLVQNVEGGIYKIFELLRNRRLVVHLVSRIHKVFYSLAQRLGLSVWVKTVGTRGADSYGTGIKFSMRRRFIGIELHIQPTQR